MDLLSMRCRVEARPRGFMHYRCTKFTVRSSTILGLVPNETALGSGPTAGVVKTACQIALVTAMLGLGLKGKPRQFVETT
jgi:hypothetical protein